LAAIIQVDLEDADDIKYIESIMSVDKPRLQAGLLTVDHPTNTIRNNLFKILQYIIDKYFLMEVIWTHISIDTLDNEEITLIDNDIIDNIVMQTWSNINSYVLKTKEIKISTLLKNSIIHFYRYLSNDHNHWDWQEDYDSSFLNHQEILTIYYNTLHTLDSSEVLEIKVNENEMKILQIPEIAASIDIISDAYDNLININWIDLISSNLNIVDENVENDEIIIRDRYWDLNQCLEIALEDEDYKKASTLQKEINDLEVMYPRLLDD
jgi:hypothetical protein